MYANDPYCRSSTCTCQYSSCAVTGALSPEIREKKVGAVRRSPLALNVDSASFRMRSATSAYTRNSDLRNGRSTDELKAAHTSMKFSPYETAPDCRSRMVGPPAPPPPMAIPLAAISRSAFTSAAVAKSSRVSRPQPIAPWGVQPSKRGLLAVGRHAVT